MTLEQQQALLPKIEYLRKKLGISVESYFKKIKCDISDNHFVLRNALSALLADCADCSFKKDTPYEIIDKFIDDITNTAKKISKHFHGEKQNAIP